MADRHKEKILWTRLPQEVVQEISRLAKEDDRTVSKMVAILAKEALRARRNGAK